MMSVVQRMSGCCRVLVVDMYHLFSFLGTVNVWRGVWNLLNHYFLPGEKGHCHGRVRRFSIVGSRVRASVDYHFVSSHAGNPEASYWISHLLPFLLLVLLNSANSILVRGVYIDAEEEGGQCVEFPIYYLRLFFQVRARAALTEKAVESSSRRLKIPSSTLTLALTCIGRTGAARS